MTSFTTRKGMKFTMKRLSFALAALFIVLPVLSVPYASAAAPSFGNTAAAGYDHFLAIDSDGGLWAWGWNSFGQLGDGTDTERLLPVKVMDYVISVRASDYYSAALTADGSLWLWGDNSFGQLGDGSGVARKEPVRVMSGVKDMALFPAYAFALKTDGTLWAWGDNSSGQLGTGDKNDRAKPVKVKSNLSADAWNSVPDGRLAAMASHAELRDGGSLWTWGANGLGQLGNGRLDNSDAAVEVVKSGVIAVDMGDAQAIAIGSDGSLFCWGAYGSGIMGDGGNKGSAQPKKISLKAALPGSAYNGTIPDEISYASDWARDHIRQAVSRGLIPLSLQGDYRQNITRAEFCVQAVTFLEVKTGEEIDAILAGKGLSADTSPFSDTNDRIVTAAYRLGIVAGMGDGTFNPDGEITREQAAVMLRNTAVAMGYSVTASKNSFPDRGKISSWASEAVDFVADRSVMAGTGSGFVPSGKYSREMADITFNLLFEALG